MAGSAGLEHADQEAQEELAVEPSREAAPEGQYQGVGPHWAQGRQGEGATPGVAQGVVVDIASGGLIGERAEQALELLGGGVVHPPHGVEHHRIAVRGQLEKAGAAQVHLLVQQGEGGGHVAVGVVEQAVLKGLGEHQPLAG